MKLGIYLICLLHLIFQAPTFTKNLIVSAVYILTRKKGDRHEDKNK